jgi:hypothetical protein
VSAPILYSLVLTETPGIGRNSALVVAPRLASQTM